MSKSVPESERQTSQILAYITYNKVIYNVIGSDQLLAVFTFTIQKKV